MVAVAKRLLKSNWNWRSKANFGPQAGTTERLLVVIDPELEMWVWSDSPHLPKELGLKDDMASLTKWLVDHRFLSAGRHKP